MLDLRDLLQSVGASHNASAFSGGYLRFEQSGSNTLVQVDNNGGGDAFLTVGTLLDTLLTQSDTGNYLL